MGLKRADVRWGPLKRISNSRRPQRLLVYAASLAAGRQCTVDRHGRDGLHTNLFGASLSVGVLKTDPLHLARVTGQVTDKLHDIVAERATSGKDFHGP